MKTQLKKLAFASLIGMILASCSSDDKKSFPKEDFLQGYLTMTGFNGTTTNFVNSGDYEFGLDFTPLAKGKILKLKLNLPDADDSVRITIWDKSTATPTVLRSETVSYTTANTLQIYDIDDVTLLKDKKYAITYNGNDWFKRNKADNSNVTYPFVVENIQIDGYRWISGTAQTFPTNVSNNYYAGDLTFEFQETE